MSINRFNAEGYHDPTVYEALTNIEREEKQKKQKRNLVFICSPFAGDIESNTRRAKRYGRFALIKKATPFVPHLLFPQFLNEDNPMERALGIEMGLEILTKCQELWVFGTKISKGMSLEIEAAKRLKMPIKYFDIHCNEIGGDI